MLSIYLFFLTVKMVCTVSAMYFRFRMVLFKNTDTYSNVCFVTGYIFALSAQILGLSNTSSITNILSGYNIWLVVLSQVLAAGVFICFLMGTLKKYTLSKPK